MTKRKEKFSSKVKILPVCGWLILAAVGYYLIFQIFFNWMFYNTVWPYKYLWEVPGAVLTNFIPIAAMVIMVSGIVFILPGPRVTWLRIIYNAFMAAVVMICVNYTFETVTGLGVIWGGTAFNTVFIFLGAEAIYYIMEYKKSVLREAESQQEVLRYQYETLKAQINPHFLFNSLNILNSLIDIHPDKVHDFIFSLSRLYRYIMAQENCRRVSVGEEMEFLQHYIGILKMRYNDNFQVIIHNNHEYDNCEIIPYTMQLLTENVTKHNIISPRCPMIMSIDVTAEGITVSNPIHPRVTESVSRLGVRYMTDLYAMYGKKFTYDNNGKRFTAQVPFL